MKLRIQGNMLRLRLLQNEVERVGKGEKIGELTLFGLEDYQKLIYTLESSKQVEKVEASFKNGSISVIIPLELAEKWANSSQVGIEATQEINGNVRLQILIEKDFKCLDDTSGEEQSDNFPNPKAR